MQRSTLYLIGGGIALAAGLYWWSRNRTPPPPSHLTLPAPVTPLLNAPIAISTAPIPDYTQTAQDASTLTDILQGTPTPDYGAGNPALAFTNLTGGNPLGPGY